MAEEVHSDIIINVDTSVGIAEIKNLQKAISSLNAQLMQSGAAQAKAAQNVQRNLINNINATGQFAARVKTIASTTETFTTRLEKNKLGMGEYFRYAGGASKTFGKLFKNEFDTIEKVARERVKTLQTQYIKLGRDANGALKAISVRPLALDMENLATKTAMAAQKQQLMNQLLKQGSTNLLNFGKNTQWAGRQLMVGFSIPLAYLGTAAAKTFMKMEEQAIRFKRVYGESFTSTAETDKMIEQVKLLAGEFTKYGVAVEETMKMAANAAAMGKQGADLIAQVNQAARLAVLGGVEQEQALETTISLTNAFGLAADQLSGKVNFLNAVENQTVTSIEDLTIAIPKAGPVIQQLGGDVEDLAFFLTAMKEGGINASEGANALKSGLASLINPTGKASEMLGAMGINIKGIVEANKGDVKGTVIGFAQALDTLDPLNRARAIEQLFGKFQFARLSTLFKNVVAEGSQAEKVLKLSNATTQELAILSERELKRVEDSPMYKFKKVVEDLKVSLVPLGEAFLKAVTPIGEFVKGFLDKFNSMGDGAKQFAVIATTVIAGIGPILLMTFGLIANGAANLIKMFLGIGRIFQGVGKSSGSLASQTEYMTQQQIEAAGVAASLDQSHGKLIQTFTVEAGAVDRLAQAYGRAMAAQAGLSGISVGGKAKGKAPRKLANGIVSVPGPKGAGDIVPAMLAPGEAVIPAKMASKYSGLIGGMVNDTIPGFENGLTGNAANFGMVAAHGNNFQRLSAEESVAFAEKNLQPGSRAYNNFIQNKRERKLYSNLVFGMPARFNKGEMSGSDGARWIRNNPKAFGSYLEGLYGIPGDSPEMKNFGASLARALGKFKNDKITDDIFYSEVAKTIESSPDKKLKQVLRLAAKQFSTGEVFGASGKPHREALAGAGKSYRRVRFAGDLKRVYNDMAEKFVGNTVNQKTVPKITPTAKKKAAPARTAQAAFARKNLNLSDLLSFAAKRGRGYADGIVSVPGPKGAGDVVPAMLSPGESVIPAGMSKKYSPLISGMINGSIPGYESGLLPPPPPSDDWLGAGATNDYSEKSGRSMARGFLSNTKAIGKSLAGTVATNIGPVSKKLATGFVNRLENSATAARFASRLSGGANEVVTRDGRAFSNGSSVVPGQIIQTGSRYYKVDDNGKKIPIKKDVAQSEMAATAQAKQASAKEKFARNAQKTSMIGMGASMAVGAATMLPGEAGKVAGDIAPLLLGLSSLAMFVQGPVSAALVSLVAAIGVPVYAMFKANEAFDQAQIKAMALSEAMGVGTQAINKFAEFSGNVTSKEIMDKRRSEGFDAFQIKTGKNSYGQSYLQSDAGKQLLASTQESITGKGGRAGATDSIVSQMSTAVASGALSASQARSIVANLAKEMGDASFGIQANAQLMSILGPKGENLLKDPLTIRVKMLNDQQDRVSSATKDMNKVAGADLLGMDANGWGGAVVGATAGAGIGAAIGGGIAAALTAGTGTPVGLAIGALVGTIAGGITGAITGNAEHQKMVAEASGANIALQRMALEQQQQISDSLEMEYEKRIAIAEAAGDTVARDKAITDLAAARLAMMTENGQLNKQIMDSYVNAQDADLKNALMGGADKSVNAKYKGTAQEDVAKLALTKITNTAVPEEKKYMLKLQLSTGAIDPMQMLNILAMPEKAQNIIFNIVTKYGGATANEVSNLTSLFVDKDGKPIEKIQTTFLTKIEATKTPEEFKDMLDFYKKVSQSGTVLDVAVTTDFLLKNPDAAKKLDETFDKLDAVKGEVSLEVLTDIVGADALAAINDDLDYFNTLKDSEKKIYTQVLATTISTISPDSPQLLQWLNSEGSEWKNSPPGVQMREYAQYNANAVTEAYKAGLLDFGTPAPTPSGGAAKKDPIDDLLNRLKMVRDASLKASGGIKTLRDIVGKTGGKNITAFAGIEQNLFKKDNVSSEFMDFYDALDAKAKSTYVSVSGSGAKAVARLTADGKAVMRALREISIGDYQSSLVKQKQDAINSAIAFKKLKDAGMSAKDALEASKDASLANAIATVGNTKKVLDLVKAFNELADAQTAADKFQKMFDDAREAWDAKKNKLEIDFKVNTKDFQKTVTDAENDIAKKITQAGGLDDLQAGLTQIGWAEDEINKKYDLRLEALDRVAEVNDRILAAQKGQLTIADALSRGDISAAAAAIQDQRARESQDAIASQRDLLDNARKAELGGVTADVNGVKMTRKDIEAKILVIEKEILDIEEKRLEPARESIRLEEVKRVAAIASLEEQELEWQKLENDIALAATAAWDYVSALEAAKAAAAQAVVNASSSIGQSVTNALQTGGSYAVPTGGVVAGGNYFSYMNQPAYRASGGIIPKYFSNGDLAKGTDVVPAMLTPGEFIMSKYAVDSFGVDNMKAINSGTFQGSTVYNSYDLNVNVRSDANPNEIARVVMTQIKQVDSQRARGIRL